MSIYQKEFAYSYIEAVKKYRKIRTIEILSDPDFKNTELDSKLYWIYVNEFKFKKWEELAQSKPSQGLRNCHIFFNKLFKKDGLNSEDLEKFNVDNMPPNIEKKYTQD